MPPLIRFIISSFADGFLLGTLVMLAILAIEPTSVAGQLLGDSPTGLALAIYGVGSSFGLGALATALWFESNDL